MTPSDNATPEREPGALVLTDAERTAVFQTRVLMFAAGLIGIVVWASLKVGYGIELDLPPVFAVLIVVVLALGGVTTFPEHVARGWSELGGRADYQIGMVVGWWAARRARAQRWIVFLLSGLLLAAFVVLVWQTGLAIESPYIPLVTAPAVFGPFIARNRETVIALVLVVALALGAITELAPDDACPGQGCAPIARDASTGGAAGRGEEPTDLDAASFEPRPGVYLGVAVTLLVLAGLISARRLQREQELVRENEGLRAAIEEFGGSTGASPPDDRDEDSPGVPDKA